MRLTLRAFVVAVALLGAARVAVRAQTIGLPASAAETVYADAMAQETAVRRVLSAPSPNVTVLKAVRTVVSAYEELVRRYPSSGYCDDALWNAARLSGDAFETFNEPQEQATAIRLLQSLTVRYPTSKFAKQAPAQIASLGATAASLPVSAASPAPPRAKTPASPASFGRIATIKDIRRVAVGDVVRVIIELDMEVSFHDERLANPDRVFVDLPLTKPSAPLKDQTLRFDGDTDVVRQVRIGRHPNSTTRVVLESAGVSSYSVYPLYSPYRLVIDCLREAASKTVNAGFDSGPPKPAIAPAPTVLAPLNARRIESWANPAPSVLPLAAAALKEAAAVDASLPSLEAIPVASTPTATTPIPPIDAPSRNLGGGFSIARQLGLGISRIVIDPGHGGHDPGARSSGTTEAELVLDVSLRLAKLLEKLPGTDVVLTRKTDEYISLQERTAIANREGADLFLSIHANASNSPQIHGIETYFLNFATNLSAAAVAARENAASGQSMGELPDVVKTIALNNKLDESRDFATYVQREMVTKLRPSNKALRDLGVKQAPFVVLIGAAMPSVLAEISFMTNAQEAKLLKTPAYRQKIAEALFDAVRGYQSSLKKTVAARSSNQ